MRREAVKARLVPLWTTFPGNTNVSVMFSEDRYEGALEFPLVLATSNPDTATLEAALEAPARFQSKEVTGEIVAEFFEGRIHHHVTMAHRYLA